jgi:thiol-disulfide isomerase/thioredoxin
MRIGFVILLNMLAMASTAIADETLPVLKAGNEVYSNVTILSVSATDIYFTSSRGLANAKLKDLDPALQKHFNFNPTNAAAIEKKHKADNALYFQEVSRPSPATSSAATEEQPPPGSEIEPGTRKEIWAHVLLNQKAPPLHFEKWETPPPDLHGKFLLVDFWATWCPACRAAIPELNAIQHDFGSRLVVIGLTHEPEEVVQRMVEPKIDYYVAVDAQARTEKAVGVTAIPHILIIDPKGIVRWEGFPSQKGYELTGKVVADIIKQYSD